MQLQRLTIRSGGGVAGAIQKDKPNGLVTAQMLFDGIAGLAVNKRTSIKDQEGADCGGREAGNSRESQSGRADFCTHCQRQ